MDCDRCRVEAAGPEVLEELPDLAPTRLRSEALSKEVVDADFDSRRLLLVEIAVVALDEELAMTFVVEEVLDDIATCGDNRDVDDVCVRLGCFCEPITVAVVVAAAAERGRT